MNFTWSDAAYFGPEAVMGLTFLLCVLGDLVTRGRRHVVPFGTLLVGTAISLVLALLHPPVSSHAILGQMVVVDGFAHFFRLLFLGITFVTALLSWSSREIMGRDREHQGEFYALAAMLCFGMMVMAESADIVMLALSLEAVSITSYILAGFARFSFRSSEAALKYVLWGAVSSAVMLYGLSLFYGLTGATSYEGIRAGLSGGQGGMALLVAILFVMAGIGYKISAVPFHFWTPDVYEGAPAPVAAIFASGPKIAGFALMIRFFYVALVQDDSQGTLALLDDVQWPWVLAIISAATMTLGNMAAIRQNSVRRLLAYSSIAHVGYMLMGFVVLSANGLAAVLFYLFVYAIMTIGAFLVVVALNNRVSGEEIDDYAGLGFREPLVAAMMFLFLISLTGLPPTAGFIGKFYLFAAAGEAGLWWLAILGVLNSVVSLYYYMRIARAMYFTPPELSGRVGLAQAHLILLVVLAVPTLVLGVFWSPLKEFADQSLRMLLGGG